MTHGAPFKRAAVGLLALGLALGWSVLPTSKASVYQLSVSSLAPEWVKPLSGPVAIFGVNMYQDGGELLTAVAVNFTDASGAGHFDTSDLAPLSTSSSSGVAIYIDNKTKGTTGLFDQYDQPAPLSEVPAWTVVGNTFRTVLKMSGLQIPPSDLANYSGPDFFIVIRTSALASNGDNFTASLASGDVWVDGVPLVFSSVGTGVITVDAIEPRACAGDDFTAEEGEECTFYGGLSTDNVGIARFIWSFGDFGSDGVASGSFVSHTYKAPGRYTVVLNVTDPAGNSDEDTLVVTVLNINQPPEIISIPPSAGVQGRDYTYLMRAIDPDGDTLTFLKLEGPDGMIVDSSSGLVSWKPGVTDANRTFRVVLGVTDGIASPASQSYFLTVQNINDPPYFKSLPVLIALQGRPYFYQAEAEDPDHDAQLVFSIVAGPRGMSIEAFTGLVSWTPTNEQVGLNRIVLAVSDGEFTAYQSFEVNVTNANDPPQIHSLPPTIAQQGVLYEYQIRAYDPDGDELSYFLSAAPANMTIDQKKGLVAWTPRADQVGTVLVGLEVSDGLGGRASQSFHIRVMNVNDPPFIITSPPVTARQGSLFTYRVLAQDPDGDSLQFTLASHPDGMSLTQEGGDAAVLEWLPSQASIGKREVVIVASDSHGGVAVQAFQIMVQDVNDPPIFLGGAPGTAYQGRPYVAVVKAYDPDGDELHYSLLTALPDMQLDRRTGLLVWYPPTSQLGEYHIIVRVTDPSGAFVDAPLNITLLPTNEPPKVVSPGLLRAVVGVRFSCRIEAYDPDGDELVFSSDSALFVINATSGEFYFTPGPGDVGVHLFRVRVTDPEGLVDETEVVIEVRSRGDELQLGRVAGFGLAGLGGLSPWFVTVVWAVVVAVFLVDYWRLRAAEREEAERERGAGAKRRVRKVVAQRETRCGLCRQAVSIKASPGNYTCSCGTAYHIQCLKKTGRCPVCGRGMDEKRKGRQAP
ncbi:MAG: tandem-95 repeat protein [Thermoplasmata archaeon]